MGAIYSNVHTDSTLYYAPSPHTSGRGGWLVAAAAYREKAIDCVVVSVYYPYRVCSWRSCTECTVYTNVCTAAQCLPPIWFMTTSASPIATCGLLSFTLNRSGPVEMRHMASSSLNPDQRDKEDIGQTRRKGAPALCKISS